MALTDNLTSYWKLGESSGTRVDSHSTNDLTDQNTVTQAVGKLGNAAQFTAANSEFLSHTDNAALSTGDIDFTLQAWAYMDSKAVTRAVVGKWGDGSNLEYLLFYSTGTDSFGLLITANGTVGTLGSVYSYNAGSPSTGTWYLIHAWHDSVNNQVGIAVNAGTPDTASYSAGVYNGTADFVIGASDSPQTNFMDGRIDAVGLWKRVLTSQDRTDLYNSGAGFEYPFSTAAAPYIYKLKHGANVGPTTWLLTG